MADASKMPKVAKRFQDLIVWRRSHEFVLSVYRITKEFPEYELFGLVSKMRRAAVSIPANISEGFKRKGEADKLRFYNISQGSLEESRYYLILAKDLGYEDTGQLMNDIDEIARLLEGYMRSMR